MSHLVCSGRANPTEFAYFDRLWTLLLEPGLDTRTKLERLFATETSEFGLPYAFFARVDRAADTHRIEVGHGDTDRLAVGTTTPLSRTFCREAVADPGTPLRIDCASDDGWADDPAFETFGFESYVGTTVEVDGAVYGTLGYAGPEPRDAPFTDREVALVELQARWVTYDLRQWAGPPTGTSTGGPSSTGTSRGEASSAETSSTDASPTGPSSDRSSGRPAALPADRLDEMLVALGNPLRREVLFGILDGTVEREADVTGEESDDCRPDVTLRHVHLPKLVEAGYVEWVDTTIAPGPNFADVEPLLRWLRGPSGDSSAE